MVFSDKREKHKMEGDESKQHPEYEVTNMRYINKHEYVEYICHSDGDRGATPKEDGRRSSQVVSEKADQNNDNSVTTLGSESTKPGRKTSRVRFSEETVEIRVEEVGNGPERSVDDKQENRRRKATVIPPRLMLSKPRAREATRKVSAPAMVMSSGGTSSPMIPRRLGELREESSPDTAKHERIRLSDTKNPALAQKLENLQHIGDRTQRKFSNVERPTSPTRVASASHSSNSSGPSSPNVHKFNVDFYYPTKEKLDFIQKALAPPPGGATRKTSNASTGSSPASRKNSRE